MCLSRHWMRAIYYLLFYVLQHRVCFSSPSFWALCAVGQITEALHTFPVWYALMHLSLNLESVCICAHVLELTEGERYTCLPSDHEVENVLLKGSVWKFNWPVCWQLGMFINVISYKIHKVKSLLIICSHYHYYQQEFFSLLFCGKYHCE